MRHPQIEAFESWDRTTMGECYVERTRATENDVVPTKNGMRKAAETHSAAAVALRQDEGVHPSVLAAV